MNLFQIPYQTNKATLVQKIAELVENKVQLNLRHLMFFFLLRLFIDVGVCFQTLEGISDIRDESDRNGMRVVIEVSHCFPCT